MSEILELYAKTAAEKGLIKSTPRPNIEVSKDYKPERNISKNKTKIEDAHPESPVYMSNSYDKINGAILNDEEKQFAIKLKQYRLA
jgi:hypothetical protein